MKKKGCRGRGKRNPQKEHFAHLLVKSLAACAQKSPNLWKLPGDLNTRGQTNTLRTYDKLGQTLQHRGFWWLLDVLAKILQTRIDVPRLKCLKGRCCPTISRPRQPRTVGLCPPATKAWGEGLGLCRAKRDVVVLHFACSPLCASVVS